MTWSQSTLGEVATLVRNGLFARRPTDEPRGVRILRISAVRDGRLDVLQSRFVAGLSPEQIEKFSLAAGDLLLTRYNGTRDLVGISAMVPTLDEPVIHPDKLIRVQLDRARCDPAFVNYQLQGPAVRQHLEPRIRTTAGQSGIAGADVRSIPLQLPSIKEQRRIVEVLEDHLSRLDAAQRYEGAAAVRLSAWWSSSLQRLLRSAEGATERIGDLLREPMRNGRSDRAIEVGLTGTRCITLTAVTRRDFSEQHTKMTTTSAAVAAALWLQDGDVFVQRSNTPELVGSAARYAGPPDWAIFPDLLIRLRPDESRLRSDFLEMALQMPAIHRGLRARAKGLAGSMPKIDQGAIAETSIPLPTLDTQAAMVRHHRDLTGQRLFLTDAIVRSEKRSVRLRRALLATAFSGQLTGRDSDLERAEELVEA